MKTETYEIPADMIDFARESVRKLNAKAEKLGIASRCEMIVGTDVRRINVDKQHRSADGTVEFGTATMRVCDVTLTAGPIAIAGWTFLAHVDHRSYKNDAGVNAWANVVTSTRERETMDDEAAYMATCAPTCDHCAQDRVRKTTYFVRNESGETKQVGSTCIADFLGHDPHALLWMLTRINALANEMSDPEEDFFGGGARNEYDLLDVLKAAATCIRRYGWISSTKQKESYFPIRSTKDDVIAYMNHKDNYEEPETKEDFERDEKIAQATLAWIQELAPRSDYEWNLVTLGKIDYIRDKDFGLACSAVAVHLRNQEKKATAAVSKSDYVGTVGERLRGIPVKIAAVRYCEGYMGSSSQLVTFIYGENLLKTFYSGSNNIEVGAEVKLTGTVKKHEEYNGVKSTMLSRIALS